MRESVDISQIDLENLFEEIAQTIAVRNEEVCDCITVGLPMMDTNVRISWKKRL